MTNNNTSEEIKRKLKRYERLGARRFQQIVFGVERMKYSLLLRCFPKITMYYENLLNKNTAKKLKKCHSDAEKNALLENARYQKLLFRREIHSRKNRNYHYQFGYSKELIPYLEWNKRIHQKGLKQNVVVMIICLLLGLSPIATGVVAPLFLGIFIAEGISAFINFECINLQEYNLTRIKQNKKLKEIEEKIETRDLKKYCPAAKIIASSLAKQEDIPSIHSLKDKFTTREELENLRNLLLYLNQVDNKEISSSTQEGKLYRKER